MKKIVLLLSAAALVGSSCGASTLGQDGRDCGIKGSGNLVSRTTPARQFDSVEARRDVAVRFSDAAADKITIVADDNVIDHVVVRIENGALVATLDDEIHNLINPHITVTVPVQQNIHSLRASSDGSITGTVTLTSDRMQLTASSDGVIKISAIETPSLGIDASSDGRIDCVVRTERCDIQGSSDAHIILTGSAAQCTATVRSDAVLTADELSVAEGTISASSDARATVQVTGVFRADAASDAVIRNVSRSAEKHVTRSGDGKVILSE